MQPLTLRAFDRAQKRILIINGYELTKDGMISVFGTHYNRYYKPDDVKILRNAGISDKNEEDLFEDDLVIIDMPHPKSRFTARIVFRHGQFLAEGKKYICEDFRTFQPSSILKVGNFNLDPLALETVIN